MNITILESRGRELGKEYRVYDGMYHKVTAGVDVLKFNPHIYKIDSLVEFGALVNQQRHMNRLLVLGEYEHPPVAPVRRKKIPEKGVNNLLKDRFINLFPIDVDEFEGTVQEYIQLLPPEFQDAACVVHYSASYKTGTSELKAHLYFWSKRKFTIATAKQVARKFSVKNDTSIYQEQSIIHIRDPRFLTLDFTPLPDIITNRMEYIAGGDLDIGALQDAITYTPPVYSKGHAVSRTGKPPSKKMVSYGSEYWYDQIGDHKDIYLPSYYFVLALLYEGYSKEYATDVLTSIFEEKNSPNHRPSGAAARVEIASEALRRMV